MKARLVLILGLILCAFGGVLAAQSPGMFVPAGEMMSRRGGHTATLLPNRKVLLAGGVAFYGPQMTLVSTAEIYDPESGRFTPTGTMIVPRHFHTATLLPSGRVLITGGGIGTGPALVASNGAEIYDPSTGTFTATGTMSANYACHEAILLRNGKVLVAGGSKTPGGVSNAELYDPATYTFSATRRYVKDTFDLNTCKQAALSLLADGKVLLVWQDGGAELYDPDAGSFTRTDSPIGGGTYNNGLPSATLLMNGTVLVAGGANDAGFPRGAELYSSGTFTAAGNMTTGRAFHTATLLPDGNVLMAGSSRFGGSSIAVAELYDPLRWAFVSAGNMAVARAMHTATLLNDGRVLVAGGANGGGSAISTAEIYVPSVLTPAPRLFPLSASQRQGAVWRSVTGEIASAGNPATAGEILSMYTTSLPDGGVLAPQVAVGGIPAEVLYFGAAPGYAGYNQVNFRVPAGISPAPSVPVRLTYLDRSSNEVTIGVR